MHSITRRTLNVLLIIILFLIISGLNTQGKDMILIVTTVNDEPITEITEDEDIKISVLDSDLIEDPYLIDVTITLDDNEYQITDEAENREIIIKAPNVDEDIKLPIVAQKEGYNTTQKQLLIKNQLGLIVTPQDYIIEENKEFYVTVTDNSNGKKPLSGVKVYIQSISDSRDITNEEGIAWLKSPEKREEIRIIAELEGYETKSLDIKIESEPNLIDIILGYKFTPIIIAVVILLLIVIIVHFKQKKPIYTSCNETSAEKEPKKTQKNNSDIFKSNNSVQPIRIEENDDAKVEEIRISRNKKEKKIVPVKSEEDETEKIIKRKQLQQRDYDWFEGTDDVRYEINKLTGEINEDNVDKWFEGVDNLKNKINEKVKKKDKKKKLNLENT